MASRQLDRIFGPDGRAVIIAMDHGLIDGPCAGFERPADTIAAVVAGGPDAILTSYGIATKFSAELEGVGLILRSDGSESNLRTPSSGSVGQFFGVEDALRVGADALAVTALPGSPAEAATLRNLAHHHQPGPPIGPAGDGLRWCPAVSTLPRSFGAPTRWPSPPAWAPKLGADFIKAPYCEDFLPGSPRRPSVAGGDPGRLQGVGGRHPGQHPRRGRCRRGRRGHGSQRVPEREPDPP